METRICGSGCSVVPPVLNSYSVDQKERTTGRLFVDRQRVTFGATPIDQSDTTGFPGVKTRCCRPSCTTPE